MTAVATPLVFARPRPELASHARDYARFTAVDVNRSGRHELWMLVHVGSTVDARNLPSPVTVADTVIVLADDRQIRLARDSRTPAEVGLMRPVHLPRGLTGTPSAYRVDQERLAFIAGSSRLQVQIGEADPHPFELWSDGRASLAQFIERIGLTP